MKRFAKICVVALIVAVFVLTLAACNNNYTVTYCPPSNVEVTDQSPSQEYGVGATVTVLDNPFALDDYVFLGWTDGTKNYNVGDTFVMPAQNITLTARAEKILTVTEALAACSDTDGWKSDNLVYVKAMVKSVDNPTYGQMTITDGASEMSVYGSYSADGSTRYSELSEKPYAGDTVLFYAQLQNYGGSKEIYSGWIISFSKGQQNSDLDGYTQMTVAAARSEDAGAKVVLEGVVARITYAFGKVPSGYYLVDATNSIYVYDSQSAMQVSIGNKVKIAAVRANWILEKEQTNAQKFGYEGCIQVDSVTLLNNDNGNNAVDLGWVAESTVKKIMDTPVTDNLTTTIFKVNALVKKAVGTGFTNYYIDDLDGTTGSYVYTQCNGGDFDWLDEFDGKICTVYLSVINAKSSASGCAWRFLPVTVSNDNFVFDLSNAPQFAIDYYAAEQFEASYQGDPATQMITTVSSELLGFQDVVISYSSSNESVAYFESKNDTIVFHTDEEGDATITVTATYGTHSASKTFEVKMQKAEVYDGAISVKDAIDAELNSTVTVIGVVGPSVVNKEGFYLIDESGVIAVTTDTATMKTLSLGDKVVLQAKRENYSAGKGKIHTCLTNAEVLVNYHGNHEYSKNTFISGKTLQDFYNLKVDEDHATEVYIVKATVSVVESAYYSKIILVDGDTSVSLYCGSANQYAFLQQFKNQEVTVELVPCNWNGKNYYAGCVLSVTDADGNVVYNTLNFSK